VRTRTLRGVEVERFYYLDMKNAVNGGSDLGEAIIGVPADKIVRTNFGKTVTMDLSTREAEFKLDLFPLNHSFDSRDWFYDWRDYWKARDRDVSDLDRAFVENVLQKIERYKMPIIRLDRENSREAICLVFEKVNVGGKKLDAFELVTAIYAADEYDLREDWRGPPKQPQLGRHARMTSAPNKRDVLTKIASTDFLQACTLLHTRDNRLAKVKAGLTGKELPQVTCNREALLGLPLNSYRNHAGAVETGFIASAGFLNELKIIWHKDVPYLPAIITLASTFAILGRDAQTVAAKQKLTQWFWSVTLGELYGSGTETKVARDTQELVEWISVDGSKPRSVDEALFQIDRLRSLYSRNSAAYKGLHALLMRHGCEDFIHGEGIELMTFFDKKIDIHHIFPKDWCKKQGIKPGVFNSVINKTPLSKLSNISIGGHAPSVYLKRIEDKQGLAPEDLDDILRTHLIEPEHLRTDNFEAFFESRINALAGLISTAMGKPVVKEHGTNEQEFEQEMVDDGDDDEYQEMD
jgi:hypothetical protein